MNRQSLEWPALMKIIFFALFMAAATLALNFNWNYLIGDRENPQIVPIKTVNLLTIPATADLLDKIKQGFIPPSTVKINVFNEALGESGEDFRNQLKQKAPQLYSEFISQKSNLVFFFDIPAGASE
jgi:hypothetical protein